MSYLTGRAPSVITGSNRILPVTGTSLQQRSANTFALLDSMSRTANETGAYRVYFNCSAGTTGVNGSGEWQLFLDGVAVAETIRTLACSTSILGLITLSTNLIAAPITILSELSLTQNQVVEVRWRSTNGQTIQVTNRFLSMERIA